MSLSKQLEAVLFYRAEPVSLKELAKILDSSPEDILLASQKLKADLADRGISLLSTEAELELVTNPEQSDLIEKMAKEELNKELGKAGLETLTIILYQGPISRPEIDQIRGVNSSFILRHLMIRGLVERIIDPKDSRRWLYQGTIDLLRFLGLESLDQLPEKDIFKQELNNFLNQNTSQDNKQNEELNS